jgi:hypothetical protein
MKGLTPKLYVSGTGGVTHCIVRWHDNKKAVNVPEDSMITPLLVEFDLATGEIKNVLFSDWKLLEWQKPGGTGTGG